MTATEKRYTAKSAGTSLQGVLFLTAGYGTRAEPLSFARPKSLLPWKGSTVLGTLIEQFTELKPEIMVFNASRCPSLISEEAVRHWSGETSILFEERPLGTSGTLSRNSEMLRGTWVICNTDFVMEIPAAELVNQHFRAGSSWTALTCDLPDEGEYGALPVSGALRHYSGVSVISEDVAETAAAEQINGGLFTTLREACNKRGFHLQEYYCPGEWMDMGETEYFRKNTLAAGSFVHPTAAVHSGASLEGFYYLGPYCIINDGAVVRDSVLLEGAELARDMKAVETVLPWFYRRSSQ